MNLRIAGIAEDSIVDGPGLRMTVFAQGCPHRCPGCHNPQTHDASGGYDADTDALIEKLRRNPLWSGVTLSGGEPFAQAAAMAEIAHAARAMGKNVVTYTGYEWESLVASDDASARALLEGTDVLVDGRFEIDRRTLDAAYRGSTNQRLIDVKASLAAGTIVLWMPSASRVA